MTALEHTCLSLAATRRSHGNVVVGRCHAAGHRRSRSQGLAASSLSRGALLGECGNFHVPIVKHPSKVMALLSERCC